MCLHDPRKTNCKRNKKQCSRQLQCEVPCSVGNVINSSLFINSSLSSLSSTSHAVHGGGPASSRGVLPLAGGGGSHGGRGSHRGEGGRGYFSPAAIYCTTTWCLTLKGLRTIIIQSHTVLQRQQQFALFQT